MKKLVLLFLILSIFACKASVAKSIEWTWEIDKAMADAKKLNKPVLINFTTDWCSWCKKMDADTYTNQKVIEKANNFISLKVNPEKGSVQSEFAKRYQVTGYPTILFIDSNYRVLHRVGGYQGPEDFLKSMDKAHKSLNIDAIIKSYKNGDLKSADELIEIYANSNQYTEAVKIIEELEGQNKIPDTKKDDYNMLAGFAHIQNMNLEKSKESFGKIINKKDIQYDEIYCKAYLYYNYSIFLGGDKKSPVTAIEAIISNKKITSEWKKEFENFLSWMKEN